MSGPPPFRLFGIDHLAALAVTAAACVAAARLTRGPRGRKLAAPALAAVTAAGTALFAWVALAEWGLTPLHLLPLHLCDLLILVAIAALVSREQRLYELLYFWAGAGALLAMITPIVPYGFPDPAYFVFFGLHAAVILAAVMLTFGYDMRPRSGAPWRVWLATCLYAALVAAANAALGTNYLFLRRKPPGPTLLDWMGPWPVYIGAAALLALALFHLLDLPFRRRRASLARGPGAGSG